MVEVTSKPNLGNDYPSDWKQLFVGDLVSITTGSRNTQDNNPEALFPFFVRSQKVERIDGYSFDKEAVLTAGDGVGTGKIFHYINGKFDAHQRVYVLSNFVDELHGKYFYWQFSNLFYDRIMSMTAKSSVDSVRQEMISKMSFPLPCLKEQQAIAEALSDADAVIASLEKLIEKKSLIKSELLRVSVDSSENETDKYSLFEISGKTKEAFNDGDWVEAEYLVNSGIRLLQTGNIENGWFKETANKKYISEQSFQLLKCKEVHAGDLLISRLAEPAGRCCILPELSESKMIVSVDITIFRPDKKICEPRYLKHLFTKSEWLERVALLCGGTTHKRISRSNLGGMKVFLPSLAKQTEIANMLENFDSELRNLAGRLNKAKQVKAGMMQELLTGRTRLI